MVRAMEATARATQAMARATEATARATEATARATEAMEVRKAITPSSLKSSRTNTVEAKVAKKAKEEREVKRADLAVNTSSLACFAPRLNMAVMVATVEEDMAATEEEDMPVTAEEDMVADMVVATDLPSSYGGGIAGSHCTNRLPV